ncbi:RES family NAD+ phosphorylase [Azomonas agilis]|uniref:RES family NAD+ phosphorylase n=1 Tax=Azomonas agilis TaxID=116849 RepID=UPI001478CADF|nr:RES family NAD+ phosphorylase [Azomonas agilis]
MTHKNFAGVFNGRGASFEDGARWNSSGHPVIYFALDMATALVEAANYLPSPRLVPAAFCKAIYEVKDPSITILDLKSLPEDWQSFPYPVSTQEIGDRFLDGGETLLLLVPSVALSIGGGHVIAVANPNHPEIATITLLETEQPVYAERMFKGIY